MKRNIILFCVCLMAPLTTLAGETTPPPAPGDRIESQAASLGSPQLDVPKPNFTRKAIILGAALGGGYQNVLTDNLYRNTWTTTVNLRAGAGITEWFQIMVAPSLNYSRIDSSTFLAFMIPVSGQFFVFRDFYVRPGVGIGLANKTFNGFNRIVNMSSKVSISAEVALGYEFRLNQYLAVGPELYYRYIRMPSNAFTTQLNIVGAQVSLTSYINYK